MEVLIKIVNDIIWSPVLIVLLLVAGVYFTLRTRCVQVQKLHCGLPAIVYFCLRLKGLASSYLATRLSDNQRIIWAIAFL